GAFPVRAGGERPPLDASRWATFEPLVTVVAPERAGAAHDALRRLESATVDAASADVFRGTAREVDAIAAEVVRRIEHGALSADGAARLLRALLSRPADTAEQGFQTAQQTAWAVDALVAASPHAGDRALQAAVARLFDGLGAVGHYDAVRVGDDLATVGRR